MIGKKTFALSLWFDKLTTIGLSLSKAQHRLVEGCLVRYNDEVALFFCSLSIVHRSSFKNGPRNHNHNLHADKFLNSMTNFVMAKIHIPTESKNWSF